MLAEVVRVRGVEIGARYRHQFLGFVDACFGLVVRALGPPAQPFELVVDTSFESVLIASCLSVKVIFLGFEEFACSFPRRADNRLIGPAEFNHLALADVFEEISGSMADHHAGELRVSQNGFQTTRYIRGQDGIGW